MKKIFLLLTLSCFNIIVQSSAQPNILINGFRYSSSYDPDAITYFNALSSAGVSPTTTQKNALNTFVVNQKSSGLWSKKLAIYFPIWSNESANAINMKSPGTYDLIFFNSPTADGSGVDWNGTSQYASTGLNANTLTRDNCHLAYYSQENATDGSFRYDMGGSPTSQQALLSCKWASSFGATFSMGNGSLSFVNNANTSGLHCGVRSSSSVVVIYRNGTSLGTPSNQSASNTMPNSIIILGALNSGGGATLTPGNYSIRKMSYASMGSSFNSTEAGTDNSQVEALHDAFGIGVE